MNYETKKQLWTVFAINYLIPLIITIGIAIILFGNILLIANKKPETFETFNSFASGLDGYYDFYDAWKPRLFSNALAMQAVYLSDWALTQMNFPIARQMDFVVSLWVSIWYVLICFLFIYLLKRRALFYIFGLFAGVSFGYMFLPRIYQAPRVYTWDLPALFFFSVFLLLFIKEKYWGIFALIPIAVGFKETVIILCAAFLFIEAPWKQRLKMLFGSIALSLGVKIFIDWYTHAPLFFTMSTHTYTNEIFFIHNLRLFQAVIPYFINAGTLIALFLLPNLNRKIFYLKLISIPFILGILLFGIADEFRIWFELIPFSLYALDVAMHGDPLKVSLV